MQKSLKKPGAPRGTPGRKRDLAQLSEGETGFHTKGDLEMVHRAAAYSAVNLAGIATGGRELHPGLELPAAIAPHGAAMSVQGQGKAYTAGIQTFYTCTAVAEGIGGLISPLPDMPECYLVLCKPCNKTSTAEMYHLYDKKGSTQTVEVEDMIDALITADTAEKLKENSF